MPRWLRTVLVVALIAAVVVLLFTVVFPRVERLLQNPTMGAVDPPPATHAERAPR